MPLRRYSHTSALIARRQRTNGRCRLARKDASGGLDDLDAALRLRTDLFTAVAAALRPLVKERPDLTDVLGAAGDAASVRAVLARLRAGGPP